MPSVSALPHSTYILISTRTDDSSRQSECMTDKEYAAFKHDCVHELKRLNADCAAQFSIGVWERWDYDLENAALTFSQNDIPKIIADIQLVGTTSGSQQDWEWGWANPNMPLKSVLMTQQVKAFGEHNGIAELTKEFLPDDEYLGWGLTAITANILGAKGGYRCPGKNGFLYFVYIDLWFADGVTRPSMQDERRGEIKCNQHGRAYETFVCEHLAAQPNQKWYSNEPTRDEPWPDAWCADCNLILEANNGEWQDHEPKIKLLCHRCYESFRAGSDHALT